MTHKMRRVRLLRSTKIMTVLIGIAVGIVAWPQAPLLAQAASTSELTNGAAATAEWTLDRTAITVGDPVALTLTVHHPAGTQALLPALDATWGAFDVVSQSPVTMDANPDGSLITRQTIAATLFAPGSFATPLLVITLSDTRGALSQAVAPPVEVTVQSVLSGDETELRDIKAQAALPVPRNLAPWLSGALAVLLLGALGWRLSRRGPIIDVRSPLQRALDELDEIDARGYPAIGSYTRHYALTTDTLRRYVELTYGVPALDMTTRELKYALMRTSISPAYRDELVGLLADADLVKFAKLTPTPEAAHDVTADARTLLRRVAEEAAIQAASSDKAAVAATNVQSSAGAPSITNGA